MSNYISANEFRAKTIGKSIDVDAAYGAQCVDLFKYFILVVEGFNPGSVCPATGYAKDIVTRFDNLSRVNPYFVRVPINQMVAGDWATWGDCKTAPKSHIAMFMKDNGNGTGLFLGQRQGRNRKVVNETNLPYQGLIGALRPKIYIPKQVPKPVPKPTPIVSNELKLGDKVVFKGPWNIYISQNSNVALHALYNGGIIGRPINNKAKNQVYLKNRGYVRLSDIIKG